MGEPQPVGGSPATPEIIVPGEIVGGLFAPTIFGRVYSLERRLGHEPAEALDRAEAALRREALVLRSL